MDAVFDPPGSVWTPVSPALARMRRLAVLTPVVSVLAIAAAVLCWLFVAIWLAAVVAVLGVGVLVWGWWVIGRNQAAWGYTEREDDLLVRHGLLFQELVVVPYGRMQFVDVTVGPLERMFGLATVQLHTAAATTDARIPGLVPEEAARLRDRLAARGESRAAGV